MFFGGVNRELGMLAMEDLPGGEVNPTPMQKFETPPALGQPVEMVAPPPVVDTYTPPPQDTLLPPPSGLRAWVLSATGVQVDWNAVPGAAGYRLRLNGTYVEDAGGRLSYAWGSLSGTCIFDVCAYDGTGRQSDYSQKISITPATTTPTAAPAASPSVAAVADNQRFTPKPADVAPVNSVADTPADEESLIFGYPAQTVVIGGGVAAVALLMILGGKGK